ncbi:class I SAM-dependent methyltransferase [Helicobacter saguini]|uniref:class I SAM-dependent methyltransferase n=1 Tax=Helicobacter saguini TaxID=1548018 RepID=UPI000A6C9757|nr:class I SAM-dependent methyltransferase [Helicobacter saguini]
MKKGQGDCDYKIIIGCTDIRVSFYDKDVLDSLEVLKDLVIESSEIKKEKDMTNKQALEFFKDLASRDSSKDSVKLGAKSDFTNFDVAFLCDKILSLDSNILELGSGTGLVTNKIYDKVKSIVALEKFSEFSRHIIKDSKVKIINEDIFDFNIESRFDAILAFGFMHYFNESEAKIIYKKCFKWLKSSGKLVVKNQFGLKQDVTIEEFSKEQNREYYSQYRLLDKEMQILKYIGFKDIKSVDIYPKECNRWDNTHFYALIAQKP